MMSTQPPSLVHKVNYVIDLPKCGEFVVVCRIRSCWRSGECLGEVILTKTGYAMFCGVIRDNTCVFLACNLLFCYLRTQVKVRPVCRVSRSRENERFSGLVGWVEYLGGKGAVLGIINLLPYVNT